MFSRFHSLTRLASAGVLVASLALIAPAGLRAEDASKEPPKELSDKVSEALNGPIKEAKDAQKLGEAIRLIDNLLPTTNPNSYDRCILSVEKAQTMFMQNIYAPAIEPLETALKLADAYNYLDGKTRLDMVETLAKLYAQESGTSKSPETRRLYSNKAVEYFHRHVRESKKPNPDYIYVTAAILYGEAMEIPDKVDTAMLKQAQQEAEAGLLATAKPKVDFYVLLLAIAQQTGDQQRAADLLEFLLKQNPNKKDYWQQLAATYVNIKDNEVRAILTFERAQKYGFLNSPRDNYNLVGMYFNVGQYEKAAELLEAGLRNGSIESEQRNWETLADSYQQLHHVDKAIAALKEASKVFPKSGNIDYRIGTLYYSIDKTNEAYAALKTAVKKGVDKPASTYVFIAYLGFELKKMDEAMEAAEAALKADPTSKEARQMRDTLKEAIGNREAKRKQL